MGVFRLVFIVGIALRSSGNDNNTFVLFGLRHSTMPCLVLGFIVGLAVYWQYEFKHRGAPSPFDWELFLLESFLGLYLINLLMDT